MIPLVAPNITWRDREALRLCVHLYHDPISETQVRAFEEEFAEFVGCSGAVAVNSGTNALIVALRAWDADTKQDGIEIPSFSCRAFLDAIDVAGFDPWLRDNVVDIPNADFRGKFTEWGPAINPHMFGTNQPRRGYGWTIDDITLSLGAVQAPYMAVCSFHQDKMITTGRGGMIVSQNEAFLSHCRKLAYYDTQNGDYAPAYSFGMSGLQAGLGRSQLRQLPVFIERRREIAERYTQVFRQAGIETPDPEVGSVFFRYLIGVVDPAARVQQLRDRGIEAGRGVNPPLHRILGLPDEQFPGATECLGKLLSIPVHPALTDVEVERIIVAVLETCAP